MANRVARWLIGAAVALGAVVVSPSAAWAHAELVSSDPAYGDRLPAAPQQVRLEFSAAMNLKGARLSLRRPGGAPQPLGAPALGSPDRRVVLAPLPPGLAAGKYGLDWFFLGDDGDLMAGEVVFTVGAAPAASTPVPPPLVGETPSTTVPRAEVRSLGPGIAGPALAGPAPAGDAARTRPSAGTGAAPRFRLSVKTPQQIVRFLDYASLAVLFGGGLFLTVVWRDGAQVHRARKLLWAALAGSALATLLGFGLRAAGLRGLPATTALDPSVMGDLAGTRLAQVVTVRAGFLAVAGVALATLSLGRDRAARSRWWQAVAALAAAGVLATRTLLGHVSGDGLVGRAAVFVHLAGVAVWLGGLTMLVVVVLPRRRGDEVRRVIPRFSRLAFGAVAAMVMAGAVMLNRVVPALSDLPSTGYGRVLLVKLVFVALLLVAAQQARTFTERRLVLQDGRDGAGEPVRLRPLLVAVGVELGLAVLILSSTAVLVGRTPPAVTTRSVATPSSGEGVGQDAGGSTPLTDRRESEAPPAPSTTIPPG